MVAVIMPATNALPKILILRIVQHPRRRGGAMSHPVGSSLPGTCVEEKKIFGVPGFRRCPANREFLGALAFSFYELKLYGGVRAKRDQI